MMMPKTVALFKQALPLTFQGLSVGHDLSNRTSVASASTTWTIWYDPVIGRNRRSSAADGFLWARDQQRPCLTVLATHKVDRVLFDDKLKAIGLAFLPTNSSLPLPQESIAYASKEVILSTGSLATAPILERSGIGKADILKAAGVKQLVDLPGVGANLNVGISHLGRVTGMRWLRLRR
jgi:choline dehydrogenase